MNRWVLIVVLFIAASWSLLLLPWVSIGESTLTGAEISDLDAVDFLVRSTSLDFTTNVCWNSEFQCIPGPNYQFR